MGDESMILPAKAKAYLEEHLVRITSNYQCILIYFMCGLQAVIMEQWEQQGM